MNEPAELYVFANGDHARSAGFKDGRHPQHRHLFAWWPSRDIEVLRGFEWGRVIVSDAVGRDAYGNAAKERRLAEGLHFARERLRVQPKLWIAL